MVRTTRHFEFFDLKKKHKNKNKNKTKTKQKTKTKTKKKGLKKLKALAPIV